MRALQVTAATTATFESFRTMGQNQSTAEVLDAVNEVDSAQKNASPQKVSVCQARTYPDLFLVQLLLLVLISWLLEAVPARS